MKATASLFGRLPLPLRCCRGDQELNNWAFQTVPQAGLNGRRGCQPRGKTLGGSNAINAMLYVRGHPSDYDDWANLGCDGWSYNDVLPYFKRSEVLSTPRFSQRSSVEKRMDRLL